MSLEEMMTQYERAHLDPRNKFFHRLGIPFIIIAIVALIATKGAAGAWWLFGLGWVLQFVGHAFERSWPEFFKNPLYLAVGPLYFARAILRKSRRTPPPDNAA